MTPKELNQLARLGAAVRLHQLEQEAAAIRKMFPGITPAQASAEAEQPREATTRKTAGRRRRRTMSPEAREAARERMRAYWAKRKGQEGAAAAGSTESIEAADRPSRKRGRGAKKRGRKRS